MKADLRLAMTAFAAGLSLGSPALAQSTGQTTAQDTTQSAPPPPASEPPSRTVGPQQLQNFTLGGTVTRPAVPTPGQTIVRAPVASPSATTPIQGPRTPAPRLAAPVAGSQAVSRVRTTPVRTERAPTAAAAPPDLAATSAAPPTIAAPVAAPSSSAPEPDVALPTASPSKRPALLPWLLAAVVLAAGSGLLLWRRRPREVLAAGLAFESDDRPQPSMSPAPSPALRRPSPPPEPAAPPPGGFVTTRLGASAPPPPAREPDLAPNPLGIVSTRLRPWLEVTVVPVACRVDADQVSFDFEVELFNSGGAPARDIRVEAGLFNAGPAQEEVIAGFMARPTPQGQALAPVGPLQRVSFRSSLQAPAASVELFEVNGRSLFIPVIAFNATYRWSGGDGQTSGSYLVGRNTGAEKLAPLRADTTARAFGGLGARLLPTAVRR